MKNGFTLIELLATITLLGLLVIISYPVIMEQIEKKNKEVDKAELELIYSGTDLYIKENENSYPYRVGNKYCIKLQTLKDDNKIAFDSKKMDLNQGVQIIMGDNNNFSYKLVSSCN